MHQSLMSRKVTLEPCTLVAMFEPYAYFVVLGKIEETYDKMIKYSYQ